MTIVRLDGKDYFVLFYRETFPVGWNIATGASGNREEWLDPGKIILREFGEELPTNGAVQHGLPSGRIR